MFQRKRIQYDDQNGSAYYGLNIPNNSVAMNSNPDRVYIAMPQNLSTQYAPTYRQVDVGVGGMAMATGLGVDSFEGVVNNSGDDYVGWNWKLGGTASSNTDGDVTTTVSANTTTGVSIVKWTGSGATATIGHGLGKIPNQIYY